MQRSLYVELDATGVVTTAFESWSGSAAPQIPGAQRLSRRRFGWEVTLLFGSAERALIFCSANNPSESVPLSDIAMQTGEGFYGRRSRRKLILYCFQTNFYE
jgi:hypothetical protein